MLIGSPGTRKSTAIKSIKRLLQEAGYTTIAADKTTKEKFMLDLNGETDDGQGDQTADRILAKNLWGGDDSDSKDPAECLIAADEFNDFIGNGNIEFISLLGTLWDYNGTYRNRIKNGKSVSIFEPTISILGGNTPTGFSLAFPIEILGQGFFSRLILIYGEPNGRKITFPPPPDPEKTTNLIRYLAAIRESTQSAARLTLEAKQILEHIYRTWPGVPDVRFESYSNRRFTHLLKLCLIHSAARCSSEITTNDVIYANTVLTHTEHLMPRALGEFGKAQSSDVAHKIMQILDSAHMPMGMKDIWKQVQTDLDKFSTMADIIGNLRHADKIQAVKTDRGIEFLPNRKAVTELTDGTVDFSLLTPEERKY